MVEVKCHSEAFVNPNNFVSLKNKYVIGYLEENETFVIRWRGQKKTFLAWVHPPLKKKV